MAAPDTLFITPYYKNRDKHRADKLALETDAIQAYDSALRGDVDGAAKILVNWSIHCQNIANAEAKLVLTYMGQLFLEAYLLMDPDSWNSRVMLPWVERVYRRQAEIMAKYKNNWGCWGLLGLVLSDVILDVGKNQHFPDLWGRLKDSIGPEGQMVHEVTRTESGIFYSYFALAPLFRTCQLFGYPDLVEKGLNWLFKYSVEPETWPYHAAHGFFAKIEQWLYPHSPSLVSPRRNTWPANLFAEAGAVLNNKEWMYYPDYPIYGVNIFRNRIYGPDTHTS